MKTLRILTYNIHKGFSTGNRKFVLGQMKKSIESVHADIVFLQEVIGENVAHSNKIRDWPSASQFEYLSDQIWSHFAYGKNAVYTEGHHGNAFLSKYPIVSWLNHDVSYSRIERRGLLHAVIDIPDSPRPIHCFSLHLGLFEKDRHAQLKKLCELAADIPKNCPILVAGDFNDWRETAGLPLQKHLQLQEAFLSSGGKHAVTFPSWWPTLPLDRVYFRGFKVRSSKILSGGVWNKLSDHLPLLVEFDIDA